MAENLLPGHPNLSLFFFIVKDSEERVIPYPKWPVSGHSYLQNRTNLKVGIVGKDCLSRRHPRPIPLST